MGPRWGEAPGRRAVNPHLDRFVRREASARCRSRAGGGERLVPSSNGSVTSSPCRDANDPLLAGSSHAAESKLENLRSAGRHPTTSRSVAANTATITEVAPSSHALSSRPSVFGSCRTLRCLAIALASARQLVWGRVHRRRNVPHARSTARERSPAGRTLRSRPVA